jgi:DNA-binding GntR family transcriptional regulator
MAALAPEPRTLHELIYDVLREHLVNENFLPGLVLGEASVARAFGSSRIPAAAALQRLRAEGLLKSFQGRGLIAAAADPTELVRAELNEAGLRLPTEVANSLEIRNHHGRIYPQVEHTIAASLAFGKFLVNESALAEYYNVSRTVAHEVLTRLDRAGLIVKESNQRWYAGPLTVDGLRDHFEMRWLLEPVALGQSMDALQPNVLEERRTNHQKAIASQKLTPLKLERLEAELHVQTVLARSNPQIVETIRRSQLVILAMHSTFAVLHNVEELRHALEEHLEIFDLLLQRKTSQAMLALEGHLRRSVEPNLERMRRLGGLPDSKRPAFLIPVDAVPISAPRSHK